jgi:hypothetical protein
VSAVSIVVPYRPDGGPRDAALDWLRRRWALTHPGWQVIVGAHTDGEWCKAAALDAAVDGSTGDVLIVHDADLICPPDTLIAAVERSRRAPWVIPHSHVRRLTQATTGIVLNADTLDLDAVNRRELEKPQQTVCEGGGIVVLTRDAYRTAGGMDPRFTGWGYEDSAWGYQLEALLGPAHLGDATLWHLWHPSAQRLRRRDETGGAGTLRKRYAHARHHPDEMRLILEERPCLST